ncbi:MAG: 3'(2'),5'-bisphosphate nucleotidase CysQ [Micavibrio aeruginosavorus]|uniref:3'(2'),5'-bisphosphate nucleotidase CysQ n=1 Tax=Micavibrio aeruginosavorus TaxID=349221 RepID=A0A7T5UIU8_9BACT|nr:MAG: 3'(2'),5'-bisphosphate nucleotidase CysQ [Micavibrio aeruginosavorus]
MVRRIAVQAGDITLQYFDESGMDRSRYEIKSDGSPLTLADTEAEHFIVQELSRLLPDVPVIGEESMARGEAVSISGYDYFWLVDPLDGTIQFKNGDPEYTVNIALVHQGVPVLGVVYAPALGELYAGCGTGTALRWLQKTDKERSIKTRKPPHAGLTVVSSKSHGDEARLDQFLSSHKVARRMTVGSSLKICWVAAGKADLYPRFGQTSEWDTAAADAVLRAAGGVVEDMDGRPLVYGSDGRAFRNPEFIARARDLALA